MESASSLFRRHEVKKIRPASKQSLHTVIVAVKQKNIEELKQVLEDVSNPSSPNYGKHWTKQKVVDFTSNPEGHDIIIDHFKVSGIEIIEETLNGEYITARAPIELWENYLNCKFYEYEIHHSSAPKVMKLLRTEEYSLPLPTHRHIAAVFNTVDFPQWNLLNKHIKSSDVDQKTKKSQKNLQSIDWSDPNVYYGYVSPDLLTGYYNVTNNTAASGDLVTQLIFATIGDALNPSDLTLFQSIFGLLVQPISGDYGGHVSTQACNKNIYPGGCSESNLDVQYIMAMGQNVSTYYYYEQDGSALGMVNFIIAIANMTNPPNVISMSYVIYEDYIESSLTSTWDTEAIKLGTMGTTILASSGDDGAVGSHTREDTAFCGYYPMFPASSPYVTAVGGTSGPESKLPEIACMSGAAFITTGGGMSNAYSLPSFQQSQVKDYFNAVAGTNLAPAPGYNLSGRGYPDISFLAHAYLIAVNGTNDVVDGTSASTPAFAGILSIVNYERKKKGLSTMGWLNPFLYSYSNSFTYDITYGYNNCSALYTNSAGQTLKTCCLQGYHATTGWDPVTGLGSINYPKFLEAALSFENPTSNDSDNSNSLSTGAIVGIAIGSAAAVGVIAVFVYLFFFSTYFTPKKPPLHTQQVV
eukprot:gene5974-6421_t